MTADYRPDLYFGVAFNAEPNDPQAVPLYVDLTDQVASVDQFARGRQYELAQTRVYDSVMTFRDPNEYLNPANQSSPYWPFVQPYRRVLGQAVWPKGSTGNLLNLNNWRVPFDGSMESYAVGVTPDWITAAATLTTPTVTTTNPQQGTKSLTYDCAITTGRQGIQWRAATIPGTQYTVSAYVRQTAAATQVLRVSDQVLASDVFNRTSASGWGTAAAPLASGGAWTTSGGAAGDRTVTAATEAAPGYGSLAVTAVNSRRFNLLAGVAARDQRVRMRIAVPALSTGGYMAIGSVLRYTDTDNHYYCELRFETDGTVDLLMWKRVAGVNTQLGSTAQLEGVIYAPGDEFYVDFFVTADLLRLAAWRSTSPAVDVETDYQVVASDTAITAVGAVGVRAILDAANTNTTPTFKWFGFSAVGSVESSTTATTGSYVRLSATWTATMPYHLVSLTTTPGTSILNTVNIDAIMLNTGAAAGTFSSTGSTIYPLAHHYVERWPRRYESAGFVGYCDAAVVDALAALAAIDVPSDYDYAVRRLSPDFYYPLDGGPNSTLYPDATSNGNPPLGLNISKFGIGTLPAGGASMEVPGDAGQTGVQFTAPSPASGSTLAGTTLGTGRLAETPSQPFVLPAAITTIWSVTVAMWVRVTDTGVSQSAFYPSKQIGTTAGKAYVPIYVDIDGSVAYTNVNGAGTIFALTSGTGLSGINITDGQPHLLVGIVTQDTTGDTFIFRYIDDQLDGANSATTASLGGTLGSQTDSLTVGCTDDGARYLAIVNGAISKLAIWNRELDPFETAELLRAGQGTPGIPSMERVEQDFTASGFYGPRRLSDTYTSSTIQPGSPMTTMQAPSWTGSIDLLTNTQNTTGAEQGTLWAAPDGYVTVEGRAERYLRLTSTGTLGESTATGEYPYADGILFDSDPTFVYADVQVDRPGGIAATGGLVGDIVAARRRYFPRSFPLSGDFETDQQAQDCADWIFYSHRAANQRVSAITLDPASYPTLWAAALSVEIGQRVTVVRRAKAGNAGAGLTVSNDYFVEAVTQRGLDFGTGQWFVDLLLSPIGRAPGATVQPWILDNTTYSVLGSTTALGF